MDFQAYIAPLRKWWWLILASSLVAAVSSIVVTWQQAPIYQASTALVIGRSVYDPNPTSNDIYLSQQLTRYYADLAYRDQVINATMTALGLDWLPEYNVQPLPNTQTIEITVNDISPIRAQAVANELANQLILQTPSRSEGETSERQGFINNQLSQLEESITKTQNEIIEKQAELEDMTSARQIADTEQEIIALETKLSTLQANYAALLASTEQGAINTLSVIEQASLPISPIGPNKNMIVLLSTAIGFLLGSGAAYLIEYLDDTIKSSEEITNKFQIPVIGIIADITNSNNHGIYVTEQPHSVITEAFRTIRTNLEFSGIDKPLNTILVTSVGVSEGKSFVAVNLATIIAQSEKKVLLLDADLRKPNIHNYLGITNSVGLSDIFRGDLSPLSAIKPSQNSKLGVIPAGRPPPNPTELIGSLKMDQILEKLKNLSDIIIIDGAPILVSDSVILSNKVDGVILIIRYGITRQFMIKNALEQLKRADVRILGAVLNGTPQKSNEYWGWYQYYSKYADQSNVEEITE
jgi:succinoglycan biosynthesis transport protein ExoP